MFQRDCPYYISIGMTWEQYWYGDPWMARDYRKAEELRQQRANTDAWLQGAYVYDALARISPILHPFAKKGVKPLPYLDKPYPLENTPEKNGSKGDEENQQFVENERLRAQLYFRNWARATKKHFEEGS